MKALKQQNLRNLEYSKSYVRDLETGNILSISEKTAVQIKLELNEMVKQGQDHLIKKEILTRSEVEELMGIEQIQEPEIKRQGRKPNKK